MAITISRGYAASAGETWTPTKQNNSTVPTITCATSVLIGRTTAGTGVLEEITAGTGLTLAAGVLSLNTTTALNPVSIGASTPGTGAFTTLSATGLLSSSAQFSSSFDHANGTYSRWKVGGVNKGIIGSANNLYGGSSGDFGINTEANNNLTLGVNSTPIVNISSTGFAVTGALAATGQVTSSGGSFITKGGTVAGASQGTLDFQSTYSRIMGWGANAGTWGNVKIAVASSDASLYSAVADFSSTGLAVTGTGSYTGALSAASLTLSSALAVTQGGTGATSASAARTALGLAIGSDVQAYSSVLSTYAGITPSANVQTLLGSANYAACRTNLGLVIGTDVQAYDADLSALAALSGTNTIYYRSASNTWSAVTIGSNLTFSGGTLSAAGGGGGSVTSVGVSGSSGIGVSGSPITGSGTITLSLGDITPTSVASTGPVTGTIADFTTSYKVAGTQVVGARGSAVASVALTGNYASDFSNIETAINNTLDRIRNHGLITP